ncbi:MAG: Asp-tRNA(Asn)/Glu-tRNA(Gln) amidotransferase subunit GatA [Alphaproteobacteria bacterium]|nr:MAG: Asp-tRNA(Asn)/Glu-tRNA(Gln) amidotransferase subunit GatA [Alphaproteobacteria bacterium]
MAELHELDLAEARDLLRRRVISSRELAEALLTEIERAAPLNAFLTLDRERTLAMADAADAALAGGEHGPMTGLPVAIKDVFCTEGVRTTAGSRILENFIPPYESTVTANLWRAGAVMLGKTNMDEFAMGSSNENSAFGPVRGPWRNGKGEDLVPGGSSGGSAAAVAARLAPGATATDTGGSIRQPASFTGTVGMKPTYGRCSRYGMIAFASSLDQAGPITRTVRDAAIMLGAMAGHDEKDSTVVDRPVPDYEAALERGVKGLKVGVPKEYHSAKTPKEIEDLWLEAIEWLKAAGAEVVDITLPHTEAALPTYYIVAPAEASSNLARYDGVRYGLRVMPDEKASLTEMYEATRGAGFGREVKRRIMIGTYVLSAGYYDAYYLKAQKVRALIARDFAEAFETVDLILTPTAPSAAFALGAKPDPIAMYYNDVFTVPSSLAGLPAISVPAGTDGQGLPLGLQLIGRAFDEETVFAGARVLEEAAGFSAAPEPWWKKGS